MVHAPTFKAREHLVKVIIEHAKRHKLWVPTWLRPPRHLFDTTAKAHG